MPAAPATRTAGREPFPPGAPPPPEPDGVRRETLAGVRLCWVDLDAFPAAVLREDPGGPRRGPRPQPLPAQAFRWNFLGAADRDTVNGFKAWKKQVEWMAGRFALNRLLAEAGLSLPDPEAPLVTYAPQGAPRLTAHPQRPISISHAGRWAVAGMAPLGRGPIGIDIERRPAGDLRYLVATAFSPRERATLPEGAPGEVLRRWTVKEAFLKFIGRGFHESLQRVELLEGRLYHAGRPVEGLEVHTSVPCPGYALTLVVPAPGAGG